MGQAAGPQLPRNPSASLQPGPLGEQADSAAFQGEGLTDPQNSVGAGALINQLPAASQTAVSPTVLPAPMQEDVVCTTSPAHLSRYIRFLCLLKKLASKVT